MNGKNKKTPVDVRDLSSWSQVMLDIFPVRVYIFIGSRHEMCESVYDALVNVGDPLDEGEAREFASRLREKFSNGRAGINGECLSVCNEHGARMWFVRLDSFSGSLDDAVTLSHECLHAALGILGFIGVSEEPPFEALCYLHEAILKRFMRYCFRRSGRLVCCQDEKNSKDQE